MEAGATRLEALVGGHVASFGDTCWQTDGKLQESLRRPDGRRYHVESIARARRRLRDQGFISSVRVFMGAKIPGAKWRSARGTTLKAFNWRTIAQKNPFSRRERRRARQEQAAAAKAAGELVPARPRFSGVTTAIEPTYRPPTSPLDPDLAAVIETARSAHEQRQQRAAAARSGQVPGRAAAPDRPPPD